MQLSIPSLSVFGKVSEKLEVSKISGIASPIIAIIISFMIVVFVVWPKFSEVLRLRNSNKELQIRANTLESKAQKLQSYDVSELEKQLIAANGLLPHDKGTFSLVGKIEQSAASSGVLLSSVDLKPGNISDNSSSQTEGVPAGSEVDAEAPSLKVQLSIDSDYKSSLVFLRLLLGLSRTVSLNDLVIASAGSSNQININMAMNAYWQSLPAELPSIESSLIELSPEEIEILKQVKDEELSGTPAKSADVPLGRSDLFAPF